MHGPGLDHTCFRPFVEALGRDYHLIFYDARLCGRSARTSARTVDLDVLADDLETVATTRGTGAVVAVAHSFAALVALQAACRVNSALKGLILVTPGVSNSIGATLLNHARVNGTAEQRLWLEAAFAGGIKTDDELARAWRTILPLYVARYSDRIEADLLGDMSFSASAFNSFLQDAAGRLDGMAAVAQLRMPLFVIAGAHDWIESDPSGSSRALREANPRADVHVLASTGHFPFAEEPQAFVRLVADWLRQHEHDLTTQP
jgi:proline iminopeptidase